MLTGIDHLVIVTRDLGRAIAEYRGLGFSVVPGGRHPVGTENALIALRDGAYMELIAFESPDRPQPHRWWEPLQQGGGLVDFCAGTDDFAADLLALRAAGVAVDPPRAQGRTRPDGYVLRWTFASPPEGQRGLVPFLIADETPRQERVPGATGHANEVTGLRVLTIAARDLTAVAGWYQGFLGRPGAAGQRDDLRAVTRRFGIGPHVVELATPADGSGPLAAFLEERPQAAGTGTLVCRLAPVPERFVPHGPEGRAGAHARGPRPGGGGPLTPAADLRTLQSPPLRSARRNQLEHHHSRRRRQQGDQHDCQGERAVDDRP